MTTQEHALSTDLSMEGAPSPAPAPAHDDGTEPHANGHDTAAHASPRVVLLPPGPDTAVSSEEPADNLMPDQEDLSNQQSPVPNSATATPEPDAKRKQRTKGPSRALLIVSQTARPTTPQEESETSGGSLDAGDAVLQRDLSLQQMQQDLTTIRNMPEMVNILEFLFLFRKQLKLSTVFTFHSLMDALVQSPGPGMLASLHTELLKGVVSSKLVDERSWTHFLAHRLSYVWQHYKQSPDPPPFVAEKHQEAQTYAALSARDRVLTLKALCDLRSERDDLRYLIEECMVTAGGGGGGGGGRGKQQAAQGKDGGSAAGSNKRKADEVEEDSLDVSRLRREPLGVDASGFTYHWLDWYEGHSDSATDWGFVLAREAPSSVPKNTTAQDSKKKGPAAKYPYQRYRLPPQAVAGQWEVVASSLDELESFGAKLQRSLRPADKKIADQVCNVLVVELKGRIEEQEKWRKAKERTRKLLGLDVGITLGRSARQRKQVSYRDDDYDRMVSAALKSEEAAGGGGRRQRGRPALQEPPPDGRRGRSRGSATDLIALDMNYASSRAARPPRNRQPTTTATPDNQQDEEPQPGLQGDAGPAGHEAQQQATDATHEERPPADVAVPEDGAVKDAAAGDTNDDTGIQQQGCHASNVSAMQTQPAPAAAEHMDTSCS